MEEEILRLENIVKDFPGVRALNGVNFDLKKGEVHALLGENGAGKSTLIKIIMGIYKAGSGNIYFKNNKIEIKNTRDAKQLGIDAIYQEQNLCADLTVAENIFVNRLPKSKGVLLINWKKLYKDTDSLLKKWNANFKSNDLISNLNVSQRQIVEIMKVVETKNLNILILDEPTAALIEEEINKLFETINKLKSKNISVIYISHRLDEVFIISDRISVLRDGKNEGTIQTKNASKKDLIKLMIGRDLSEMYPKRIIKKGETVLKVTGLRSGKNIRNINFELKEGEILGLYGLLGSGKSEVGKSLFGRAKIDEGNIEISGVNKTIRNVNDAIFNKIGFVPADRKRNGVIDILSVKQNLTLASIGSLGPAGFIRKNYENEVSNHWINKLNIKTPSIETKISSLSGGNQQKTVIGRWLGSQSQILILNEPTHGVDVGAKVEIYNIIEDFCEKGISVIMISSDIPELTAICDRVIVLYRGEINGVLTGKEITQENILKLAMSRGEYEKKEF